HIKRSVESVLNQTFTNFELIVVDDGSTDNGLYEIKNILDSRLKIYKKENGGVSSARNFGIIKSKAEYIGFLDADDEWDKSFLETVYKMNNIFPNKFMYATAYKKINNFLETNIVLNNNDNNSIFLVDKYFEKFLKLKDAINTSSSTVLKKEILLEIGLFPEKLTNFEDWNVWFKVALIDNLVYSRDVLSNIYLDATNRSSSKVKYNPLSLIKSYNELIVNIDEFIIRKNLLRKNIDLVFRRGSISVMRQMIKYKQFDFVESFKRSEMYKYINVYQRIFYLTRLNKLIYLLYKILNIVGLKK
ncbi:glycosyltransferase family 2 protein, partial [Aliarcobacter butzleri]|uniref:glycosyltransferase family 2 protein n=1 Tax=Aliarcobacter butzleri TaxID=28197 RepID=UPI002B2544E1